MIDLFELNPRSIESMAIFHPVYRVENFSGIGCLTIPSKADPEGSQFHRRSSRCSKSSSDFFETRVSDIRPQGRLTNSEQLALAKWQSLCADLKRHGVNRTMSFL